MCIGHRENNDRGTMMPSRRFETDRLLSWLEEILQHSEAVNVDIVVVDTPDASSSLQITVHDVPGRLAGLQVRSCVNE
jgi:Mrp family chromosome partitioning ATPase